MAGSRCARVTDSETGKGDTLAGVIGRPFDEQAEFLRQKLDLPTRTWQDIWHGAHDRAFVVAGAAKADLLADLHAAVQKAIDRGTSLDTFRQDFRTIVARHGWHGWLGEGSAAGFNWRTKLILETNLRSSYAAGRWAQLNDPEFKAARPFWRYVHSDTVAQPRPLHVSWHGKIIAADHPWWKTHYPPNGWGCRCRVHALAADQLAKYGRSEPDEAPDDGSYTWLDQYGTPHSVPRGIDPGWGYAPGERAGDSFSRLIQDKLIRWDAQIGASAFADMESVLVPTLADEFAAWADKVTLPRGELKVVGALSPKVVQALTDRGIVPASAHLAVRDQDVIHTHRDSKKDRLPWDWYRKLPLHLIRPQAVLLERGTTPPVLLMVFDTPSGVGKMVVRVDYTVAQRGGALKTNVLGTGRLMNPQSLSDPVRYEVLDGKD